MCAGCAVLCFAQVCSSMFGGNAANSLEAILCGAVQLELFMAQQQAPDAPGQAMSAAQQQVSHMCVTGRPQHCSSCVRQVVVQESGWGGTQPPIECCSGSVNQVAEERLVCDVG